jgi:hypothetical protein
MFLVKVQLLLDIDESSMYDAINEILRDKQRTFAPESCLIDYAITGGHRGPKYIGIDPVDYKEGEAWASKGFL